MTQLLTDMSEEEMNVALEQLFPSKPIPKRKRGPRVKPIAHNTSLLQPGTVSITTQTAPQSNQEPIEQTKPQLVCSTVSDPREYVLDVFDQFISPGISATTPTMEKIRRLIFRRAVAEFAIEEIRRVSAQHTLSLDDIFNIAISSANKAGVILV